MGLPRVTGLATVELVSDQMDMLTDNPDQLAAVIPWRNTTGIYLSQQVLKGLGM